MKNSAHCFHHQTTLHEADHSCGSKSVEQYRFANQYILISWNRIVTIARRNCGIQIMRQTAACKKRNVRTASQETITCAFCTRSVLFQQQHIRGINGNFIHDFCDLRVISSTFDLIMLEGRIECRLRHLIIWCCKGELNADWKCRSSLVCGDRRHALLAKIHL